jgi:hypothetical protein
LPSLAFVPAFFLVVQQYFGKLSHIFVSPAPVATPGLSWFRLHVVERHFGVNSFKGSCAQIGIGVGGEKVERPTAAFVLLPLVISFLDLLLLLLKPVAPYL